MTDHDMSVWKGNVDTDDGPRALRWHQMVKPLSWGAPPGVVLVGFACDEGVRRNRGRVGAKGGPRAVRAALANLAWHQERPVYDGGNISCNDLDLVAAQTRLSHQVAALISSGHSPLVVGGGHEAAWGTFQGIASASPGLKIGVINIDSHLDLRGGTEASSGTPFAQMAKWAAEKGQRFHYMCLGVSPANNTMALCDKARILGTTLRFDADVVPWKADEIRDEIETFARRVDCLHLSIDLDVLSVGIMPAVSAPAGRGLSMEALDLLVGTSMLTRKVAAVDVVEFNPTLDPDGNAARVAARVVWDVAQVWPVPDDLAEPPP